MARCQVCRQRLARDSQACDMCGEPVRAHHDGDLGAAVSTQHPDLVIDPEPDRSIVSDVEGADAGGRDAADLGTAPARRGRRKRKLVAGGVLVALIAATTAYVTSRDDTRKTDGAAYGVVRLSSDPGPRWQVQLAAVAPVLGFPQIREASTCASTCALSQVQWPPMTPW